MPYAMLLTTTSHIQKYMHAKFSFTVFFPKINSWLTFINKIENGLHVWKNYARRLQSLANVFENVEKYFECYDMCYFRELNFVRKIKILCYLSHYPIYNMVQRLRLTTKVDVIG